MMVLQLKELSKELFRNHLMLLLLANLLSC